MGNTYTRLPAITDDMITEIDEEIMLAVDEYTHFLFIYYYLNYGQILSLNKEKIDTVADLLNLVKTDVKNKGVVLSGYNRDHFVTSVKISTINEYKHISGLSVSPNMNRLYINFNDNLYKCYALGYVYNKYGNLFIGSDPFIHGVMRSAKFEKRSKFTPSLFPGNFEFNERFGESGYSIFKNIHNTCISLSQFVECDINKLLLRQLPEKHSEQIKKYNGIIESIEKYIKNYNDTNDKIHLLENELKSITNNIEELEKEIKSNIDETNLNEQIKLLAEKSNTKHNIKQTIANFTDSNNNTCCELIKLCAETVHISFDKENVNQSSAQIISAIEDKIHTLKANYEMFKCLTKHLNM